MGEFITKYKATLKTKHLITKHGREAAENLLKLNKSEINGVNEKDIYSKSNTGRILRPLRR